MKTRMKLLLTGCFLAICSLGFTQQVYIIDPVKSKMAIAGTSNIHDWMMNVNGPEGRVKFKKNGSQLEGISDLSILVRSRQIKSGRSIMDNKTYDALQAQQYSYIQFRLSNVEKFAASGNYFKGTMEGQLKIAGVSNTVIIPFEGTIINEDEIQVRGKQSFRMTDYKIEPPTALAGTMKTGNEVTIIFDVVLSII
jgi:polyisoprenoid-binding protein YceI